MYFSIVQQFKRIVKASILIFASLLLFAIPVLAAYTADILLTTDANNDYDMFPFNVDMNVDWLVSENYIDADGLDTLVEIGATAYPHMLVDDRVLFADSLTPDISRTYNFTTDNTPLSDYYIIDGANTGSTGYITTLDAAALEPANNFEFDISGYYSQDSGGNFVFKDAAFRIYPSGGTDITAAILNGAYAWTDPTANNDPDAVWNNEANAYDNNVLTAADTNVAASSWSSFLELSRAAINCSAIRYYADRVAGRVNQIDVDVYYGAAWHDVYQGYYVDDTWETRYIPGGSQNVTAMRYRFYNSDTVARTATFYETDFWQDPTEALAVTAAGVAVGEHRIQVTADAVNLKIYIDTVEEDSAALGGASVPDNGNDWYWTEGEVMAYADFLVEDVAAAEVLRYQPIDIISGTTLPDRTGAAQDGAFTFGDLPEGTTLTLGSLLPDEAGEVAGIELIQPGVAGEINQPGNMYPTEGDMEVSGNVLSPFISQFSILSYTPIPFFWWYLYGFLALVCTAVAYKYMKHMWLSGIVTILVTGVFVAIGAIPFWFIIVLVIMVAGAAVMERSPSF